MCHLSFFSSRHLVVKWYVFSTHHKRAVFSREQSDHAKRRSVGDDDDDDDDDLCARKKEVD